ncbi:MAG: hypothetical protein HC812_20130 [Leptolyngbya sp. RL_3_1]|nr:hypothetical protein [Leptolyngbya sp. RL_3_1]
MAQNAGIRRFFLAGLQRRFGQLTPNLVANAYWDDLPPGFQPGGNEMTWLQDPIDVALTLHPVFEGLGIAYYLSGGIAAIFYGEYRTTQDADLVLNLDAEQLPALVTTLENLGFYVAGVDDAVGGRLATLQAIHTETLAKADLTLSGGDEFEIAKFARRRLETLEQRGQLYLITPEDLVLSKLRWRQRSQSEKQWRDILGILKVQSTMLDLDYLQEWAVQLKLAPDLAKVLAAAGIQSNG